MVTVASITVTTVVVAVIPTHDEHGGIDKTALSIIKLALLVSPVAGKDAKRLVLANSRVTAHGLIVYRNAAVYAAARNQVSQDVRDVVALGPESVVGTHNPPAVILGGHAGGEKRNSQGTNE